MKTTSKCPRCSADMRNWAELIDDEKEVVKRLPKSADYSFEERQKLHRWCTRCWFESEETSQST